MQTGYCCNVHPGRNLEEVYQSLGEYSVAVKSLICPDEAMGVGLWFSATTAEQLADRGARERFRGWLSEAGLIPYTLNGFPFGDFHQPVVKHQVYQPTWADVSRLDYTLRLAQLLHDLLPAGERGTISTLPLGWPAMDKEKEADDFRKKCAENLRELARQLAELNHQKGRELMICIEPEPGCYLESAEGLVRFFGDELMTGEAETDRVIAKHLGVCHDICHSAVMFEDQARAIEKYHAAGIAIGKVQVSSALALDFNSLSQADGEAAVRQLSQFAEPRYLHQTVWKRGDAIQFFEDLPAALAHIHQGELTGELRVHFHVPIFADRFELLSTSQADIRLCLATLRELKLAPPHFEIETYAWNVLPSGWQPSSLPVGLANELDWFRQESSSVGWRGAD